MMSPSSSRNIEPPITSLGSVKPDADIVNFQVRKRIDGHFQKPVLFLERVVVPESFKHSKIFICTEIILHPQL